MALNFNDPISLFNFTKQDGNGIKGLVDLGLKEVPKPCIQPPEDRIIQSNSRRLNLPPIDLSMLNGPDHDLVAQNIVRAAETLGFFQVVNHGMSVELLEAIKDSVHGFFEQPVKKKAVYLKNVSSSPLVCYGSSNVSKESDTLSWRDFLLMKYTNDADSLIFWPPECRKPILEYVKKSTTVVEMLLKVLFEGLGVKVTPNDQRIEEFARNKAVIANFYPTCPNPDLTLGVTPHTDLGTLTVLLQDEIGGLHIKIEDDESEFGTKGDWLEIPPIPGALVINIGDTLQLLSNGRYKSVEHTVRTSEAGSRVSIPVFMAPQGEEKIAPFGEVIEKDGVARYKEVVFDEYTKNFYGDKRSGKKGIEFAEIKPIN